LVANEAEFHHSFHM
jgi:hypothetical protein